jgi:tetratricopeptide (TPR) repeat protein
MATLSLGAIPNPTRTLQGRALYQMIMPLLAGGAMLGASLLPWFVDPLGNAFPAWQLPIDIGWQLRSGLFSYGLLCLCCALYAFFIAYLTWKEIRRDRIRTHSTLAGLLCLMPVALFFTQYLFIDMGSITQLAQHELQALFIQNHFGYHVAAQFIPIRLDTFDYSTLTGRFRLLLNQLQPGLYLPFLGTFCLLRGQTVGTGRGLTPFLSLRVTMWQRQRIVATIACFALLLIVFGRGPAALACRFYAEHLLTTGDYTGALTWLDRASMLNPSLEQLSAYHIERGQAWYYLHPTQPTIESQVYLADFYLTQDDYLSAYQKLIAARQQSVVTPSWLLDELSITLIRLAEMQHPLNGPPVQRVHKDLPSITWLNALSHIDPHNVYAHYTLGRIAYDTHNFTACEKQMFSVIALSSDANILSSAYTYLSLSNESEGNYTQARDYLFTAQAYDPAYRNNTAREELSGLH